ncbi:BAG domain-containing protein [Favolaschia claudopus]|uniref:BAG domain-containing protein n=1 Tax=Favolaschia claudopus TaxID=2862362 RepID=A0AAW0A9K1_9AGAR
MTQYTLPLATQIPHNLATEILDKSANNWPVWEKRVLSCLTIVGLEGYVSGAVPCPDYTSDPMSAMNWHQNDRAVVSFLTVKVSREEQEYVAPYAPASSKMVWDALVARHFDATLQIHLLREMFGVKYGLGTESPAETSARIDKLATRILDLGTINKATLVSAAMVNAVQGDLDGFYQRRTSGVQFPQPEVDYFNSAEQAALSAITTERSTLQDVLFPQVSAFLSSSQGASEAEWSRLMELLFQLLGRLEAIVIAPGWNRALSAKAEVTDEVQRLQNQLQSSTAPETVDAPHVGEAERVACAAVATELAKINEEIAPSVAEYLQRQPNAVQRSDLINVLSQCLARLDNMVLFPDWNVTTERTRAVEEVRRLLTALERSQESEHNVNSEFISHEEQVMIAFIASEMAKVQAAFIPAVASFPRSNPQLRDEKERRDLSKSLFETVQRLDSTHIDPDWEQARKERRNCARAVEQLQEQLDSLPGSLEEQEAVLKIADERAKTQPLLFAAVTTYLANRNEKERLRLSDLLLQAHGRLNAIVLGRGWPQATAQREGAANELQRLQDNLTPPSESGSNPSNGKTEESARTLLVGERGKIQLLSVALELYLKNPNERGRGLLSELLLQTLVRLDGIAMDSNWTTCRQERKTAIIEVQNLQDMLDAA